MTQIKSRYKKIAKLVKLSSETIREYGFEYFITAAYLQLKRNKLAVFSSEPEVPKNEEYSEIASYDNWMRKHRVDLTKEEFEKRIAKFSKLPTIAIILQIDEKNKECLKDSIDSIIMQYYDKLRLYFFVETNSIKLDMKSISANNLVTSDQNRTTSNNLNQLCMSIKEDYIMFIKCGDLLTKNSIFTILESMNNTKDYHDIIYSDEDQIDSGARINPFFKPDWSPDLFLSFDYISNFYLVNKKIFAQAGGFDDKLSVANHYDLLLRLTEITNKIHHIQTVLISCKQRNDPIEIYEKEALELLSKTLNRRKIDGTPKKGNLERTFKIEYVLKTEPKVSIIIPTKDNIDLLKRCIKTLQIKTSYKNYEIIIIDNNSCKEETLSYFASLPYSVIKYQLPFNFSKMNNFIASQVSSEYLLFLNDDTAVLESNWLTEMVKICQQKQIGIVGPKLVFSDNTIQHAGMAILSSGAGFHPLQRANGNSSGYHGCLNTIRNCSAVTGACLLIKKELFDSIGGFDNEFDLYYGDTDLCLQVIKKGYRVVYTPHVRLLHEGSSKIKEHSTTFYTVENHYHFIKKWPEIKNGDPFYNPNLTLDYKIAID